MTWHGRKNQPQCWVNSRIPHMYPAYIEEQLPEQTFLVVIYKRSIKRARLIGPSFRDSQNISPASPQKNGACKTSSHMACGGLLIYETMEVHLWLIFLLKRLVQNISSEEYCAEEQSWFPSEKTWKCGSFSKPTFTFTPGAEICGNMVGAKRWTWLTSDPLDGLLQKA